MFDGNAPVGFPGVALDVTERKRPEAAQDTLIAELNIGPAIYGRSSGQFRTKRVPLVSLLLSIWVNSITALRLCRASKESYHVEDVPSF